METFIAQFTRTIETHQVWAGPLVGLIAFGESLVLIGMLIPASALMMIVGGLVGAGVVEPLPVLICAIVGAVLGDIVSYFLGAWLGRRIVHRWPLNGYRQGVARARLFFRRYGFASVFFGRFFGPIRCTVPLVAGMMGMDQRRFQMANVLSAVVWAPVMLAPGWLAGTTAARFGELSEAHWLGLTVGATIVAIIATVVGAKLFHRGGGRRRGRSVRGKVPAD